MSDDHYSSASSFMSPYMSLVYMLYSSSASGGFGGGGGELRTVPAQHAFPRRRLSASGTATAAYGGGFARASASLMDSSSNAGGLTAPAVELRTNAPILSPLLLLPPPAPPLAFSSSSPPSSSASLIGGGAQSLLLPPAPPPPPQLLVAPLPALASALKRRNQCIEMNRVLARFNSDLTTELWVVAACVLLYAIVITVALVGNTLVVTAIARTRSLRNNPANVFILAMSVSDLISAGCSGTVTPITSFTKKWLFGHWLCATVPFVAGVSLCFSTLTLTAVSLNRFVLVCFPTRRQLSHRQALWVVATNLALSCALSAPIVPTQTLAEMPPFCGEFCYESWENPALRRFYGSAVLVVQFIVPLTIIVFCYTTISIRLNQRVALRNACNRAVESRAGGGGGGGAAERKSGRDAAAAAAAAEGMDPLNRSLSLSAVRMRRIAERKQRHNNIMFVAMVVAFVMSWIWSIVFNLIRDFGVLPDWMQAQEFMFGVVTHLLAMTSTVWNPILYALLNSQFRCAFLRYSGFKRVLQFWSSSSAAVGEALSLVGGRRRSGVVDGFSKQPPPQQQQQQQFLRFNNDDDDDAGAKRSMVVGAGCTLRADGGDALRRRRSATSPFDLYESLYPPPPTTPCSEYPPPTPTTNDDDDRDSFVVPRPESAESSEEEEEEEENGRTTADDEYII